MVLLRAASTSVLLSLAVSALAEDTGLSADIVGCTDVNCPRSDTSEVCTVTDNTFVGVGLTRIVDVPGALAGLSLVKGVHIPNSGVNTTHSQGQEESLPYKSVYYLGTPSALDVSALAGCAVVFNDPPSKSFPGPLVPGGNTTDTRAATGTCPDVIAQNCIDKLTEQAQKVNYGGSNPCSELQKALQSNAPQECGDFSGGGNGLGDFTVTSLTDLSTITQAQNGSSDCWPVLPKSDGLAEFAEHESMSNYTVQGNLAEVYKITPILTVFTNSTIVQDISAQLSCLKVVTTSNIDNSTDTPEDAAPLSSVNLLGVSAAALATIMYTVL